MYNNFVKMPLISLKRIVTLGAPYICENMYMIHNTLSNNIYNTIYNSHIVKSTFCSTLSYIHATVTAAKLLY